MNIIIIVRCGSGVHNARHRKLPPGPRQDSCDLTRLCWCVRTATAVFVSKQQSRCRVFVSLTGLDSTQLCWCVCTLIKSVLSTKVISRPCFEVVQSNFNSPFLSLPLSIGISFSTVSCLTSSLFHEDSHQDYYDHFQA
jgi:hypothetical protein